MLPRAEINVTPMIDVMLVLLIIFMIVTPALGSRVVLPQSSYADPRPEEPREIVLFIDRVGAYLLSGSEGPKAIPAGALGPVLTTLYHERTLDRILYLKADEGLSFGPVQDAIDIARRSGVRVIAAVTEPRRGGKP